jgi:hypothetical protein
MSIQDLKDVIKKLHGCEAEYLKSVDVLERFEGKTVWEGVVEVFTLKGHPKAQRCFAWAHRHGPDDKETRYVTVLEIPPVDTPQKAVQAAIVAEIKNRP